MTDEFKPCVVGLGKAGLPLMAVIADSCMKVCGIDVDEKRIELLKNKGNPIPEEPGLAEIIEERMNDNMVVSSDYSDVKDCNAYIIIVPLFIDDDKKPDFSILDKAFSCVSDVLNDGDLVVLETTVPPGTTVSRFKEILDETGKDYHLAYSPERIMTGKSISRYKEFPKVVGGVNEESTKKVFDLYSKFCKQVFKVSNATTAEMVKVAEGVYRDVNISLANELFKVTEKLGVDFKEMREAAAHEFCHIHLPGNVGGHCIPVYPWFLINDFDVPLIKKARLSNDDMIKYYADKLSDMGVNKGDRVLLLGITYRSGVKELAYTRSIPMIELLKHRGYDVMVNDPMYSKEEIEGLGYKYCDNFDEADGVIVMNNDIEYRHDLAHMKPKVVDVHGILE